MLLTTCIIAKDSARYISRTISSIKDLTDEIIVIDMGSIDETRALAREAGAKVFTADYKCCKRQGIKRAVTGARGEWILFLKPDEELMEDYSQFRTLLKNSSCEGYYLPLLALNYFHNIPAKAVGLTEDEDLAFPLLSIRLFRNKYKYNFNSNYPLFQGITKSILKNARRGSIKILQLPIIKLPFLSEIPSSLRITKFFPLEKKNLPDSAPGNIFLKNAVKYYRKRDYIKAISWLESGYSISKKRMYKALFLEYLISLLLENENYKRAARKIEYGIKEFPGENIFLFQQAYLHYFLGNYDHSLIQLKNILTKNSEESKTQKLSCFFLGLNYMACEKWGPARLYLEQALEYFYNNKVLVKKLLEIYELGNITINLDHIFKKNETAFFLAIEVYYQKSDYKKIESILLGNYSGNKDSNLYYYWLGKTLFQLKKYQQADINFREISPDFVLYEEVLNLRWILNLKSSGKKLVRGIINQIKLLGNISSYNFITLFNEIFFHQKRILFKFENHVARFNFYQTALYFLTFLLEFNCQEQKNIVLDIIRSIYIERSIIDTGIIFYKFDYPEEAYKYLKSGLENIITLPELKMLAEVCLQLDKKDEYWKYRKKIKEKF